jgi:zinc protease
MDKYKEGISQEDLEFTKNALIKSNARRFESQFSLLNMLQNISAYDLPSDYIAGEERIIEGMTLEEHKRLANEYLDSSKMGYLVIGDAATQFEKFKNAGFDEVLLLDKDAKKVEGSDIKM